MPSLRTRANEIIFGSDTPAGKAFDLVLLVVIILSVVTVILESVPSIRANHSRQFDFTNSQCIDAPLPTSPTQIKTC